MQLGERLGRVRKQRGVSAAALALELDISRNTLKAAESGDPSVTMGTYLRILSSLGLVQDLALVATGRGATAPEGNVLAARHARLEAEVTQGRRDARSLVSIPHNLATTATLVFPKDAFGKVRPW